MAAAARWAQSLHPAVAQKSFTCNFPPPCNLILTFLSLTMLHVQFVKTDVPLLIMLFKLQTEIKVSFHSILWQQTSLFSQMSDGSPVNERVVERLAL